MSGKPQSVSILSKRLTGANEVCYHSSSFGKLRKMLFLSIRKLTFVVVAAVMLPRMVYALKLYPYDDKRKAFPVRNGACSFGLPLTADEPWRIG